MSYKVKVQRVSLSREIWRFDMVSVEHDLVISSLVSYLRYLILRMSVFCLKKKEKEKKIWTRGGKNEERKN